MMVRNIHKAIQNDWFNINVPNFASLNDVLVATGRCGLALYVDVPVLGAMYERMASLNHDEKIVGRLLDQHFSGIGRTWRMFASEHRMYPVDETAARVSLYKAFGILPDLQEAMEAEFRAFIIPTDIKIPFFSDPRSRIQYYLDR
jgi:hypothetical protein